MNRLKIRSNSQEHEQLWFWSLSLIFWKQLVIWEKMIWAMRKHIFRKKKKTICVWSWSLSLTERERRLIILRKWLNRRTMSSLHVCFCGLEWLSSISLNLSKYLQILIKLKNYSEKWLYLFYVCGLALFLCLIRKCWNRLKKSDQTLKNMNKLWSWSHSLIFWEKRLVIWEGGSAYLQSKCCVRYQESCLWTSLFIS